MNRKQRRASKKKSLHPFGGNDLFQKALKSDPLMQKYIEEANLAEMKKQDLDIMTLFLLTLHESEGFGRKRLLRVAKSLSVLQDYYTGKYQDCDLYAMRLKLKEQTGIDIEHLQEEVEKCVTEKNTKEG